MPEKSPKKPHILDLRNVQPQAVGRQMEPKRPAPRPHATRPLAPDARPDSMRSVVASGRPEVPAYQPERKISPLRKWGSLIVLSLALAIIIIDTTLLNVSLRTIIIDLGTTIQGLQWVISAYALTLAALTVTGGRLGDLFGRKRMFMLGAVLFAIGSFIASISHNLPMMLAGESIIEGIGAALMMPATSSLLVSIFKGRERAIAFGR